MPKILARLEAKPHCASFMAPLQGTGQARSRSRGQHPAMTIGTVLARLGAGAYTIEGEADTGLVPGNFAVDVRLVFESAMQSNRAGTATHHRADLLRKHFDCMVAKFEAKRRESRPAEKIVSVRPMHDGAVSFRVQLAGGPAESWVEASHFSSEPRVERVIGKKDLKGKGRQYKIQWAGEGQGQPCIVGGNLASVAGAQVIALRRAVPPPCAKTVPLPCSSLLSRLR